MNIDNIINFAKNSGVRLLHGILVLIIGFFLVHWVLKLFGRKPGRLKIDPTVKSFLSNLVRLVLYLSVILFAADVMGVPMTSIVTILATAGAAFSLAMQGALGNLIGGFFLLIFQPIKVDEYVKLGEFEGTVKSIGSFYTDLLTFDGLHVSLPNGILSNTSIVNYTREGRRRMELIFSVSYISDVKSTLEVLKRVAMTEKRVLKNPAPAVILKTLSSSSLDFAIRAWTRNEDYWDVYYSLIQTIKEELDKAGIRIPYPQMDVHIMSDYRKDVFEKKAIEGFENELGQSLW